MEKRAELRPEKSLTVWQLAQGPPHQGGKKILGGVEPQANCQTELGLIRS